jgi:ferritin-like metal-binding protein YciE
VEINSLRELYIDQLRDLYDAENQLIKALPKMAREASSDELRQAIEEHLEQTRGQAERLEQIFEQLGEKAKGKKCKGMQGVIEEGKETLEEEMEEDTKDAAIIGAAQRVEHYEIASYGTARTGVKDLAHHLIRIVQRQDQNSRIRNRLQNLAGGFQPVKARHSNVEDENVRFQLDSFFNCLATISGLAADLPFRLRLQQCNQSFTYYFMVVSYHDS